MKNFLAQLFGLVMIPVMFLNFFAGIVGTIWLLFSGDWPLAVAGLVSIFVSSIFFGIAFLPQIGLTMVAMFFFDRNLKFLAWPIMYIATIITMAVITFWVVMVYAYGLDYGAANRSSLIPISLWCYAVAVGPIQYMASKEPADSVGTNLITIFVTIGGAWLFFAMIFLGMNFPSAFWGFLLSMVICLNVMFYDVAKYEKFQTDIPSPLDNYKKNEVVEGETIMKEVKKKPRKIKKRKTRNKKK